MIKTALYVHIPFCDHKCIYCDFYSVITEDKKEIYLSALLKEIDHFAAKYGRRKISSIFFGGGTPSIVSPNYIRKIIEKIDASFGVQKNAEITLETNPGTVNRSKLRSFFDIGINRISIGVQSFDESELKFLTRIHDKQTAINTVNDAALAGFENISIDLIFNLPGQTKEIWTDNLRTAFALPIKHLSAYSLILERGTILNKMVLDGKVKIQDQDFDSELYEQTIRFSEERGFRQYEVSNFALPEFECCHNLSYWQYDDYFGFGTAAHSFVDSKRRWNFSPLSFYIDSVYRIGNAVRNCEQLSKSQQINEYVMLALRSRGLDLVKLEEKFGFRMPAVNKKFFDTLIENGFAKRQESLITLTAKGYAICDELLLNLNL